MQQDLERFSIRREDHNLQISVFMFFSKPSKITCLHFLIPKLRNPNIIWNGEFLLIKMSIKVSPVQCIAVGGNDGGLGGSTVQSLGRFVRTLLQLLVIRRLLHQVQDRGSPWPNPALQESPQPEDSWTKRKRHKLSISGCINEKNILTCIVV